MENEYGGGGYVDELGTTIYLMVDTWQGWLSKAEGGRAGWEVGSWKGAIKDRRS